MTKTKVSYIKVRKKKGIQKVDGTFSCSDLEANLNARKGDVCTLVIGAKEYDLEVI